MPIDSNKGPGGVDASYGRRTTVNSFDRTKTYDQGLFVNSDGQIVTPSGDVVGGGSEFVKNATTGMFETTVGAEKALAFPAGPSGEARGVYVGRSDTLAGLVALTANAGELSVATDAPFIVRHGSNAGENAVFGNEVMINVGEFSYGNEASGFGWISGEGGVPTFLLPTGVRKVVLFSTRVGEGVHPDITASTAFILKPTLADLIRCPEITITVAARLNVGGCSAIGYRDGVLSLSDVSSTAFWPPVIKLVTGPGLNLLGLVKVTYPTAISAVTQADAHALVG